MMASEYSSPRNVVENAIRNWWVFFLLMLAGGLIGYLLTFIKPPRYEAVAQISTSIDYSFSPELEDYEEDRAINKAGELLLSDDVLEAVHDQLAQRGLAWSFTKIKESFSVERRDDIWTLRVIDTDPQNAAMVASLWLKEGYSQLDMAFKHAQNAYVLTEYIASLQDCLNKEPQDASTLALCAITSPQALETEINKKTTIRNTELELSRTLYPASRYSVISDAVVPTIPTIQPRGVMVLFGALLGFLVAILIISFNPRFLWKKQV